MLTCDYTCSDNYCDPRGVLRTPAHKALQRDPSDSPRLVHKLRITVTHSLWSSPPPNEDGQYKQNNIKKQPITSPGAIILLSQVFTFPLTFPCLTLSVSSPSHATLLPSSSSYLHGLFANYATDLEACESLRPVVMWNGDSQQEDETQPWALCCPEKGHAEHYCG